MSKKTKVIILIVSVLLSFVIIFFSYFGIFRYIKLHYANSEKYIENYAKLQKADDNSRVVISFTTLPDRINKIKPMILSLLDQTVKVDAICMNLPYNHKNTKYTVPKEYEKMINVYKVGKDYGPGTKIIPTLLREGEADTKIIYLDDDYIYGEDFIQTLVEESNKYPDDIIYTQDNMKASGGVLVKPNFISFDNDIDYYDDKWFSDNANAKKHKINYSSNFKIFSF